MESNNYEFNLDSCNVVVQTGINEAHAVLYIDSEKYLYISMEKARASKINERQQLFDLLAAIYHEMGKYGIPESDRLIICEPFKYLNKDSYAKAEVRLNESARMLKSVMKEEPKIDEGQYLLF